MTDSLRSRIAAVLPQIFERVADGELVEWEDMADAVIAKLGLQPETKHNPGGAILTRLDGKVLADTRHQHRWVTPWENDESPVT